MLSIKELEKLYDFLNTKEQSLDKIAEGFQGNFTETFMVFRSSYALSNLLTLNLLTSQQRIVAIYLLLDNYKTEGIRKHPFGATIIEIQAKTAQPFERKMISDIIVDSKRERYAKSKIEALAQEYETSVDFVQQRPQMIKIKEEFIGNLPRISANKKSEVRHVVSDFNYSEKDKRSLPPEFPVSKASIKEAEISHQGFNVGFLRPVPKFIDVGPSEYHWLSPGILTDVHWDNTAQLEKKLAKTKNLLKKGLINHLTKEQYSEIDRALEAEPYAVLNLGLTPQNIGQLVKQNPYIAVAFLIKVAQYPIIQSYLEAMEKTELSINSIDVLIRLVKGTKIPNQFVMKYTLTIMKQARNLSENNKDRLKIAKLVASFIRSMTKCKIIDPFNFQDALEEFTKVFIEVEEVQALIKLMKRQ